MKKRYLKDVTLVAVSGVKLVQTIEALLYSQKGFVFGGGVLLISDKKPLFLPRSIKLKLTDSLRSIDDFNHFMVYDIYKYVDTEYMMLIHYDGFVVNPKNWTDEFLNYDYIGAPWPVPPESDNTTFRDEFGTLYRVGNSVSLRSQKLMRIPMEYNLEWNPFHGNYHEDGFICVNRRRFFEEHGCKFAPVEIAARYSREIEVPECEGIEPFCFHKWRGPNKKFPRFSRVPLLRKIRKE